MRFGKEDLDWAASQGVLTPAQADALWAALSQRPPSASAHEPPSVRPRFDFIHLGYYFGALLVIGAMGWFMTLGWESFGGAWIFAIASSYALAFVLVGRRLWGADHLRVPGGLLITMAVCMTPLAVYGLERWLGLWPDVDPGQYREFHQYVKGGWFVMEYATIGAALLALRFFRFPFLTAPIAFCLWYISMDLAPLVFGHDVTWTERAEVSAAVGLAMLVLSYVVDRRAPDLAGWGYLFGLMAFWGGLVALHSDSELRKLLFCFLNIGLMAIAVLLQRRVFMVFGALGVFGYLGYLSWRVFEDSLLFPFVLSGLGIGLIFASVKYQKNRQRIEAALLGRMPGWLKR